jgi:anti-sigma-K factor RskA
MSGFSDNPDQPDRPGEYVLGVLRGEERRVFEAELARDPRLAAEVAAWEQRLLPLALAVPAAVPPQGIWARIETAISAPPVRAAPLTPQRGLRQAQSPARFSLWRSLGFWRGLALAAAAAAIILAILRPVAEPPPPNLVALLQATPQAAPVSPAVSPVAFTLAMRPDGALSIAPVSTRRPPDGRVWQLWAIAPNAKPVSIGLMHVSHMTRFKSRQVPAYLRKPHILFAVSVEPPGGSPTGLPTGPVVFTGPLLTLQ